MSFKSKLGFGASTFTYAMFLTMVPGQAADVSAPVDLCAVSGVNAKASGSGGWYESEPDDGARFQGDASLSLPLGCLLGLQFDGSFGDLAGDGAGGVAAHLFMRDPDQYLLGAYASYSGVDDVDIWRVGAEAHLYLNNVSLEVLAGFEDADVTGDDFFTATNLAFYPTENLRLSIGYEHFQEIDAAAAGFEWQVDGLGLPVSLFAHGAIGDDDYATVFGGVTLYFGGEEKSLIRRHREDDPDNAISKLLVKQGDAAPVSPPTSPPPPPPPPPPVP
ncbi:MAG TPA: hypothetical protein VJ019_03135 [Aestuariivirga sp.]|nr:hypothetical protein [Aestuariivirga sp.]